jgi:predicted ATP-dependent endonuclease of OLD family
VNNLDVGRFNVLVGRNNHGKTNFFEAIEWFYNGVGDIQDIKRKGSGDEEMFIEIEFFGVQKGIERMSEKSKNKPKIKKIVGDLETAKVRQIWHKDEGGNELKEKQIYNSSEDKWETPTGPTFMNEFLPTLQFVKTEVRLKDKLKYGKKTEIGEMLSGVINEILKSEDSEYRSFVEKFQELFIGNESKVSKKLREIADKVESNLKKQFPECNKVQFDVKEPIFDDLLKNFQTKVDDGHMTSAEEKGDGMQRALMLAVIQTYAEYRKENENIKNFVFLIDEAELHLHPTAQRSLKEALMELSMTDDQVFISSHSSVLMTDEYENQLLFRVEKTNHKTSISKITDIEKQEVVYELLGGSPSDLLLPKNFLVVEGSSESKFLLKVIERFYSNQPKIKILYAEGNHEEIEKSMHGINKAFIPLYEKSSSIYGEKMVLLCDKRDDDRKKGWDSFVQAYDEMYRRGQIKVIPEFAMELYYPSRWKKTFEELREISVKTSGPGLGRFKVNLAEKVGNEITKKEFEDEMSVMYDALKLCWEKAY